MRYPRADRVSRGYERRDDSLQKHLSSCVLKTGWSRILLAVTDIEFYYQEGYTESSSVPVSDLLIIRSSVELLENDINVKITVLLLASTTGCSQI